MNEDPGGLKTLPESEKDSSPNSWLSRLISPLKELSKLITLTPQKSAFQSIVIAAAILFLAFSMLFHADLFGIAKGAGLILVIAMCGRVMVNPKTLAHHALSWISVSILAVIGGVVCAGYGA